MHFAIVGVSLLVTLVTSARVSRRDGEAPTKPIMLDSSGGFTVAGKVLRSPQIPSMTLSCDHGYVEYFIPWTPRKTGLFMWHSSSTQTWQNRFDGGEGFKDKFLRRDYPVYLWDGPRIGRSNWACEPSTYRLSYQDQSNFVAWNFGPSYPNYWNDTQFPYWDEEAWLMTTRARYVEYDTVPMVHLDGEAAAIGVDSGRLGESIILLTNSVAGLRGQVAVTKSNTTNIKAIVAYESYGYVFPDNANITAGGAFGPIIVPLEDFKKLAKLTAIQFVFSDHRDESFDFLRQARLATRYINMYGGNAEVLKLGEDVGLKGSTHIAFADMDNEEVAGLLDDFLKENGLDDYEVDDGGDESDRTTRSLLESIPSS